MEKKSWVVPLPVWQKNKISNVVLCREPVTRQRTVSVRVNELLASYGVEVAKATITYLHTYHYDNKEDVILVVAECLPSALLRKSFAYEVNWVQYSLLKGVVKPVLDTRLVRNFEDFLRE